MIIDRFACLSVMDAPEQARRAGETGYRGL